MDYLQCAQSELKLLLKNKAKVQPAPRGRATNYATNSPKGIFEHTERSIANKFKMCREKLLCINNFNLECKSKTKKYNMNSLNIRWRFIQNRGGV